MRLLGALNWVRDFVQGYARLAAPLHAIVRDHKRWRPCKRDANGDAVPFTGQWQPVHQQALASILERLERQVCLAHLRLFLPSRRPSDPASGP